jgi:hypothetical protein
MDLGVLGLFVPASRIYRALDQSFEETAKLAAERARRLARRPAESQETGSQAGRGAENFLRQLFDGSLGESLSEDLIAERVVIEIDGVRYRLVPA